MAKTRHNNLLDSIDEIITDGKNKGILQLYTEDEIFTGRRIRINGKNLYHFGTTGYLGLEQDDRLKRAAMEAISKYGTQFPLSKTYLSFGINKELEEVLCEMYDNPILVSKNSTLAHMAVIPTIVRDEDAVVMDHQVHWSVQNACQMLKLRGVSVDMIRHSSMEMLERKLKEYGNKYDKVWYMIDGVYSMFGDFAPLADLMEMSKTYPALHLYIDDVHGMSWAGKHGTGWVMSQLQKLPDNVILTATLSKSFGASGSVTVFPDPEILRKVKTFGGPLTFSAQLEPSSVAAALASAKIHLSDEIYEIQEEIREKVEYCNALIRKTNLPLIVDNNCPVFFIGTGLPSTGYKFVEKLMQEGFYVNLGIFPAVPVKNTGVRFTISRHNHKEDIHALVEAMKFHHLQTLAEEGKTQNEVRKKFNLPFVNEDLPSKPASNLNVTVRKTIREMDKDLWNSIHGDKGIIDWDGLKFLEEVFSNNEKPEDNWEFYYYEIYDGNKLIISTFFTSALWKEDMLAPAYISRKVEEQRINDPYYLTSIVLSMGSLATEGVHLYLDRLSEKWQEAMTVLLEKVALEQERLNATMIVLRDFPEADDQDLKDYLIGQGFIKVAMPETCINEDLSWNDPEEYLKSLSARSRRHLNYDVIKYSDLFEIEVKTQLSEAEGNKLYSLYNDVSNLNFDINYFKYPQKLLRNISEDSNWEFIVVRLKNAPESPEDAIIGFCLNYKNCLNGYTVLLLGMNYEYLNTHKIYKQLLYQITLRANKTGANKLFLGFSASIEKKKFGATLIPKVAFVQTKDNYNLEYINNL